MDNTLMEQRSQFAEILGLEGPVPEEVLKLAVENESYARNLLLSKDHPEILEVLLKKPRSQNIQEFSNTDLIKKAATAILRWSQTGFSVVNVQVLERREDACLQCSNLRDPKGMLQQLIPSAGLNNKPGHRTGKKVCDLCGCNVSNKIRMPSEACPGIHPDNHELTLWGEPIKHRNK